MSASGISGWARGDGQRLPWSMRFIGYHGTPGPAFQTPDAGRLGSTSGYAHARYGFSLTSSEEVARHYAEHDGGSIMEFAATMDNPLVLDDRDRQGAIGRYLEEAIANGHDGLVLRQCAHTVVSPGEPSDICVAFDLSRIRYLRTVQEPEEVAPSQSVPAQRRGTRCDRTRR